MERGKGLWKKALSLVLSLAMVLTLLPAQFAYAVEGEGSGDSGNTEDELPETLMYFSFDDDITDGSKVKAEIVTKDDAGNALQGVAECSKEEKKVGTGALRLNNVTGDAEKFKGVYLKVPKGTLANADGSGKTDLTISYWSKITANTGFQTGWVYFASQDDNKIDENAEKANPGSGKFNYIGVYDREDLNAWGGAFAVEL